VATALSNLSLTLVDPRERLEMEREALAIRGASLRPTHPDIGTSVLNIGVGLAELGRVDEALAHYRDAGRIWEAENGPECSAMARVHANISHALRRLGRHEQALAEAERSLAIAEAAFGDDHVRLEESLSALGWAHHELGDHVQATRELERGIELVERAFGKEHPSLAYPLRGLGSTLLASGRTHEGVAALERAVTIGEIRSVDRVELAAARFALARALWPTDRDRALALARKAEADYAALPGRERNREDVNAWLGGRERRTR